MIIFKITCFSARNSFCFIFITPAVEPLSELEPSESLAVMNWVGLPPVQSCPSQLSYCVQDALTIIALGDVQLTLHCTEPVVSLKRVGRVRKRRRVM